MEWMCTCIFTGLFLGFGWCFGAYLFSKLKNWLEAPTYTMKKKSTRRNDANVTYRIHK